MTIHIYGTFTITGSESIFFRRLSTATAGIRSPTPSPDLWSWNHMLTSPSTLVTFPSPSAKPNSTLLLAQSRIDQGTPGGCSHCCSSVRNPLLFGGVGGGPMCHGRRHGLLVPPTQVDVDNSRLSTVCLGERLRVTAVAA